MEFWKNNILRHWGSKVAFSLIQLIANVHLFTPFIAHRPYRNRWCTSFFDLHRESWKPCYRESKRVGQQSQMSPRENKKKEGWEGYGRRKERGHLRPLKNSFSRQVAVGTILKALEEKRYLHMFGTLASKKMWGVWWSLEGTFPSSKTSPRD